MSLEKGSPSLPNMKASACRCHPRGLWSTCALCYCQSLTVNLIKCNILSTRWYFFVIRHSFIYLFLMFESAQDPTVVPHLMSLMNQSLRTQEYITQIISHCCKVCTVRPHFPVGVLNVIKLYMLQICFTCSYLSFYCELQYTFV